MSFFNVMIKAYTGPSTANFRSLARNPGASVGMAYLWVAVAAVISAILSTIMVQIFPSNPILDYVGDYGLRDQLGFGERAVGGIIPIVTTLLCAIPISAVLGVIFFAILTGLLHLIAGLLGGKGEYGRLAFLFAALSFPISIVNSILSPIPYLGCLTFLISLYVLVLQVLAIEGVYQFGIAKAFLTWLIPFIGICLIILCLTIGVIALLGPVISEAFNEIQRGISP
jgi:hypothetical protein